MGHTDGHTSRGHRRLELVPEVGHGRPCIGVGTCSAVGKPCELGPEGARQVRCQPESLG